MVILVIGGLRHVGRRQRSLDARQRESSAFRTRREGVQEGPQTITRNGKATAVVVSFDEWSRKTSRKGTLAEFLLASPLRGADLDLDRNLK